jgi:5-methylthioribose kinase
LAQGVEADQESLVGLVRKAGLSRDTSNLKVETLGGGVSCVVLLIRGTEGAWVVKQALPQLRVKDEWRADRSRIFAECSCLRLIRDRVPDHPAPEVFFEDRDLFACVLQYAGDGNHTWKQDLLSGLVDQKVTQRVADVLAEFHSRTLDDPVTRREFEYDSNFNQLRLDPYLVTTTRRHPDIEAQMMEIISFLSKKKYCLVHGDFSPKNILILPDGRVWVIDCEVAHYGNPAFDVAFCTNHLLLKSVHMRSRIHLKEASAFWSFYWSKMVPKELEAEAVRTAAALMLARIDGKSPVEYLDEGERGVVREVSHDLVKRRVESFVELLDAVRGMSDMGKGS